MSDAQGGLCHLTLQYIDWLSLQLLPDTAETEWLDRHGQIWLVNSDGSKGRKEATFATGILAFTGEDGTIVPIGTRVAGISGPIDYETTAEITLGSGPTEAPARALDPGIQGNLESGDVIGLPAAIPGVDGNVVVVEMTGGVDTENDDDLRVRILQRIQNPAMGGSQANYVTWTLAVPGVTRAWANVEQGVGTITIRFLMDELREDDNGWPLPADVQAVHDYVNKMRPVTVKDCYVSAPIKEFVDVTILDLLPQSAEGAVKASLEQMLFEMAAPGETIYAAWISYAIMNTAGVQSFHLETYQDHPMPSKGHMAVLGTLLFNETPEVTP